MQPPLIHRFRRLEQVVMGPVVLWKFHEIPLDLVWLAVIALEHPSTTSRHQPGATPNSPNNVLNQSKSANLRNLVMTGLASPGACFMQRMTMHFPPQQQAGCIVGLRICIPSA